MLKLLFYTTTVIFLILGWVSSPAAAQEYEITTGEWTETEALGESGLSNFEELELLPPPAEVLETEISESDRRPLPDASSFGISAGQPSGFTESSLIKYVAYLYRLSFSVAGLLAFIMVVWGGIEYALSAGSEGRMDEARDRIAQAFIGLALLALSYIILNTINPKLVRLQDPATPELAPRVLPSLEEQAIENRRLHTLDGSVETALENPDLFFKSAAVQEGFLTDQIAKESTKPNPDEQKLRGWMQSYEDLQNIKAEVKRRSQLNL